LESMDMFWTTGRKIGLAVLIAGAIFLLVLVVYAPVFFPRQYHGPCEPWNELTNETAIINEEYWDGAALAVAAMGGVLMLLCRRPTR
jgi:uncharacterized membrane protein